MMRPKHPHHDEIIRKLWAEGVSSKEIGERLGRTKNSIIGRVHRMNLAARPSPIHTTNPEHDERIRTMRASGMPSNEIGAVLGRTGSSIRGRASHLGIGRNVKPPPHHWSNTPRPPPSVFEFRARSEMAALRSLPARRAPVVIPYVSRSATCEFPLWGDFEPPTHEYCGKPVWYRSYCRDCAGIAYRRVEEVAA